MAIFPSSTLSEAIVLELGHGPLAMDGLRKALARRGISVTVQAVYKALRGLRQKGLVFLQKGEATLNIRWLQQLETFVSLAQHAYADPMVGNGNFLQLRDRDRIVYSFKNPVQVDAFWNHVLYILFAAHPKLDRWYAYSSHHWFLLGRRKEELALMGYMRRRGTRYLFTVGHRTSLDRAVAKDFDGDMAQYHMLDKPHFPGRHNHLGIVLNVLGDYVIEAQYDKRTVDDIEAFYRTHARIEPRSMNELEERVTRRAKIRLVIMRDAAKAKKLTRLFEKNFYLGKKRA